MWTWIIKQRMKIGIYAAIGIALLFTVRWYGNRQWTKGVESGRQYAADRIIREKEAEWKEREAQLEKSKTLVENQLQTLNRATAEIVSARKVLRDEYATLAANAAAERKADERVIISVPDSELRSAIRTISRELAGQ